MASGRRSCIFANYIIPLGERGPQPVNSYGWKALEILGCSGVLSVAEKVVIRGIGGGESLLGFNLLQRARSGSEFMYGPTRHADVLPYRTSAGSRELNGNVTRSAGGGNAWCPIGSSV